MAKYGKHIFDNDKGYRRFKRELQNARNAFVVVGLQEGDKNDDGESIAFYGTVNEFGSGKIPARSFMRSTFDEKHEQLLSYMRRQYDLMKTHGQSAHKGLTFMGELHQRQIQTKIRNLRTPPNAESTIAQKGSDNPLVNEGAMLRSVRYIIKIGR